LTNNPKHLPGNKNFHFRLNNKLAGKTFLYQGVDFFAEKRIKGGL